MSTTPRGRRGVIAVLLLALVVRLAYLGLYYQHAGSPLAGRVFRALIPSTWDQFRGDLDSDHLFSDQAGYDRIARNLIAGQGYRLHDDGPPTAFRPPVYPLFLAGIYALGGSFLAVRLVQLVAELGTVLLLYLISRRVFGSERAALLGAGLYAVYFPLVIYAATLFSETIYTFLLALFAWLLVRAYQTPEGSARRLRVFGAGLALGLVTLTKPTTLLFPLFLLLPIVFRKRGPLSWVARMSAWWRDTVRDVIPVALGMVLVLAPWTVRNAVVLGQFVPVSTGGGRMLWGSNYIPSNDPMISKASQSAGHDAPEADRGFYQRALRNIAAHPGAFITSSIQRFIRLWFNLGFESAPSPASLAIGAANLFMALLMFWALLFHRGPWVAAAMPLFLLLLYFSLVHMVLEGYIRYALPVIPYLMLGAAFGGVTIRERGLFRMTGS